MRFYKIFLVITITLLTVLTFSVYAYSKNSYFYKITLSKDEEITFVHDTILNYDGKGNNQEINYIELSLDNSNVNLSLIQAHDLSSSKDTLLNQINEERASTGKHIIGGINGEFFQLNNGQTLFTTISDGIIFSSAIEENEKIKRPTFYIDKDKNYGFDYLTVLGTLKFLNTSIDNLIITSINKLDSYNNVNITNYKINEESTYYPHEGLPSRYMLVELTNSNGEVHPGFEMFGIVVEVGEMTKPKKINKNQILITSYGELNYHKINYEFLNLPISLKFNIFLDNNKNIKNDIFTAFTGHEYLIKDGKKMDSNYYNSLAEYSLINTKNSRTAVGITKDNKIILFTVDKSSNSIGMDLYELSIYLEYLGIVDAINLDGGGSTFISFENNEHEIFLMNDQNKHQRSIPNVISVVLLQK